MARKTSLTQFDFSGGELPPLKTGRTDDPIYSSSLEEAYNTIPRVEGPIMNRPGTERLISANSFTGSTRIIPLDPVLGQGVLLEFTDGSIRVIEPQGYGVPADPGLVSGAGSGFTDAVTAKTVTVTGSGVGQTGSTIYYANGVYNYYNTVADQEWYRRYVSATEYYELNYYLDNSPSTKPWGSFSHVDTSSGSAVTTTLYGFVSPFAWEHWQTIESGAGSHPTPDPVRTITVSAVAGTLSAYSEAEIPEIRYTFSGDTIYLTHPEHPPAILYKDASDAWQYSAIDFKVAPLNPKDVVNSDIQLTLTDYDYEVSLYIKSANFSTYNPGDHISYKHNGEYILAEFVEQDGSEVTRAIVKPVRSVVTGLDPAALIELQTSATFSYLGAGILRTLSTNKAVFSKELEGSYIRFVDIEDDGVGVVVKWAKIETYIGTDIAGSGFYYNEGVIPTGLTSAVFEVDSVTYAASPGVLLDVTDFVEYDQVDGVSAVAYDTTSGILNDTYVESDVAVFDLSEVSGVSVGNDIGRTLQIIINDTVLTGVIVADGGNTTTKARVVFDGPIPYTKGAVMGNGGVSKDWQLGAFYTGNYPAAVAIFSQRLIFGGTHTHPETVWSSEIDSYFNFSPVTVNNQVLSTTGFSVTLGGPRLSKIRWIYSGSQLLVGMEGSLWMISSSEGVYTAFTAHPRKQAEIGSIIPPVQIGVILLLVHASGRQIHQVKYQDQSKSYDIDDGSVIPNHLFNQIGQEISDIVIQNAPNPIIWVTRADGLLCSLIPSWSSRATVYGLSKHTIGSGVTAVTDTLVDELAGTVVDELAEIISADGFISSVTEGMGSVAATASLYDTSSGREQLYLISSRGLARYIERVSFNYEPDTAEDRTEMMYLDSATVRSVDTPKTVWSEFEDYSGETITVVADGVLIAKDTSFTGTDYTLSVAASQVIIGYSYTSRIRSLPVSTTGVSGNSGTQGRIVRHSGIIVRMKSTLSMSHGSELTGLIAENFENNDDILNGTDLHTGDVRLSFHGDRGRRSQYYVQQTDPYPMQIVSITEDVEFE